MADRLEIERLLRQLYAARAEGQLERLCALFAARAQFRIAGASDGKPIAISAIGSAEIRAWLAMMIKTFRVVDYDIESMVIEGSRAAVHWRADILSKITGARMPTELVDLVEVREQRILTYREFFAPG